MSPDPYLPRMDDSLHLLNDLNEVFSTLYADLGKCREELQRDFNSQYRRRLMIREFCTFVEVSAYQLKRYSLYITRKMIPDIKAATHVANKDEVLAPFSDSLLPAELMILEDFSPALDESGAASTKRMFPPTAPNIRFAFATYLKVIKTGVHVDFGGKGWRAMKTTIAVRNRLTHPKCLEDIAVSDDDLAQLVEANDWLVQARVDMMSAANIILERTAHLTTDPKTEL